MRGRARRESNQRREGRVRLRRTMANETTTTQTEWPTRAADSILHALSQASDAQASNEQNIFLLDGAPRC